MSERGGAAKVAPPLFLNGPLLRHRVYLFSILRKMIMETSRQTLYNALALVRAGLTTGKETSSQSGCYVFRDGWLYTYNEEIACRMPYDIGVEGAVTAKGVLDILERLPDDNITITDDGDRVVFKGSGRRLTVAKETAVTMPIEHIPFPELWLTMPGGLIEACVIAAAATRKDHDKFLAQCVRLGPGFVEACDNERASRVTVEGLDADFLIRGTTIKQAAEVNPTEWAAGDGWAHFTNHTGLVFSCRSHIKDYPDLDVVLAGAMGNILVLPGSLNEAVERAQKASAMAIGENFLTIKLKPGLMLITGEGVSAKYEEQIPVQYTGPAVAFTADPAMLTELAKTHTQVFLDGKKISVVSTNMVAVMGVKSAAT